MQRSALGVAHLKDRDDYACQRACVPSDGDEPVQAIPRRKPMLFPEPQTLNPQTVLYRCLPRREAVLQAFLFNHF